MAGVLVDTDRFVDHLRGAQALDPGGAAVHYSTVTRCELFAGPAEQERAVAKLLEPFRELPVDRPIAELAGRIRRERGLVLPDAVIAATALVHGLALSTRNRRDFGRVPRLALG